MRAKTFFVKSAYASWNAALHAGLGILREACLRRSPRYHEAHAHVELLNFQGKRFGECRNGRLGGSVDR